MSGLIEPEDSSSAAYRDGFLAAQDGQQASANPHPDGAPTHLEWSSGYRRARVCCLDHQFVREQNPTPPPWASDRINAWDAALYNDIQPFVTVDHWLNDTPIDILRVVGTTHHSYQGMTWLEMLSKGKRMRSNLAALFSNPGYYASLRGGLDTIFYRTLDGQHCYVSDGNHRNCIARFYLTQQGLRYLQGVSIRYEEVDVEFFELYRRVSAFVRNNGVSIAIGAERQFVDRDNGRDYSADRYAPLIVWRDFNTGKTSRLDRRQTLERVEAIYNRVRRKDRRSLIWSRMRVALKR